MINFQRLEQISCFAAKTSVSTSELVMARKIIGDLLADRARLLGEYTRDVGMTENLAWGKMSPEVTETITTRLAMRWQEKEFLDRMRGLSR